MMNDDFNHEEVIQRLLVEVRAYKDHLARIEKKLSDDERTNKLSIIGAIDVLFKALEEKEKLLDWYEKELEEWIFGRKSVRGRW